MNITQHDYAVVIRQEDEAFQLLLFADATLPNTLNERHFWQTCRPVNQAIRSHYGLNVVTLRPIHNDFYQIHEGQGEIRTVYLMQYRSGTIPSDARWYAVNQLSELSYEMPLTLEKLRILLQQEVTSRWYQFDWFHSLYEATQTICIKPPEQIRAWERSSIWRLPTETGDHYLKLLPDIFSHEAKLTLWLNQQFPAAIPQILPEIMPQSMRTRDYGQVDLMSCADLSIWVKAIRQYGEIQVQCVHRVSDLSGLGVPQRGLAWIEAYLETFLMDDTSLTHGDNPLKISEIDQLRAQLPTLKNAIITLQQSAIPETLEHGDLWAGQIIVNDDRVLITDWSDSSITHPFFSLVFFLTDIEDQFPNEPTARQQLEDAYFEVWQPFGDGQSVYQSARLLADVFNALRYHIDILPQMDQRWEMHNMIAYDLRLFLSKVQA